MTCATIGTRLPGTLIDVELAVHPLETSRTLAAVAGFLVDAAATVEAGHGGTFVYLVLAV